MRVCAVRSLAMRSADAVAAGTGCTRESQRRIAECARPKYIHGDLGSALASTEREPTGRETLLAMRFAVA